LEKPKIKRSKVIKQADKTWRSLMAENEKFYAENPDIKDEDKVDPEKEREDIRKTILKIVGREYEIIDG